MMAHYRTSMRDIYRRLARLGFTRAWLLGAVLPDWWDDALADEPANRRLAEFYLARFLDLQLDELSDPERTLRLASGNLRFKLAAQANRERLMASALVAKRAGRLLYEVLNSSLPRFSCCATPREVRTWIFDHGYAAVDFHSLLHFCWDQGIIVFHFKSQPGAHLDGMAAFHDERPVITLGSPKRPSWLVFHLAHELNHILRQHVVPDSEPLADLDLDSVEVDGDEAEANRQAVEILTGSQDVEQLRRTFKSKVEHSLFLRQNSKVLRTTPGVIALLHARLMDTGPSWRYASAFVGEFDSGEDTDIIIGNALSERIAGKEISEDSSRFLAAVAAA
ncbi:MAG TPA: hypothetical protein VE078_06985 [Thermoanaerobaculia bacterium]|nr:hypothetical protein [Thermoanaerobaculia bacterium]